MRKRTALDNKFQVNLALQSCFWFPSTTKYLEVLLNIILSETFVYLDQDWFPVAAPISLEVLQRCQRPRVDPVCDPCVEGQSRTLHLKVNFFKNVKCWIQIIWKRLGRIDCRYWLRLRLDKSRYRLFRYIWQVQKKYRCVNKTRPNWRDFSIFFKNSLVQMSSLALGCTDFWVLIKRSRKNWDGHTESQERTDVFITSIFFFWGEGVLGPDTQEWILTNVEAFKSNL